MRCPRCGNEMPETEPCPKCGARVRHMRLGADPDFTVRRVRLDTPSHLRPLLDGAPRLRREPSDGSAGGRNRAFALGLAAIAALVIGFGIFLALGGGSADDGAPAAPPPPDAGRYAPPEAGHGRIVLPSPDLGEPYGPVTPLAPASPAAGLAAQSPVPPPEPLPLAVGVRPSIDGGAPVTVLPMGRYGVATPAANTADVPAAVLQIAAVPSAVVSASCTPTACSPDGTGWVVADKARELLESDPALAACWAEATVRQGRRYNVPAMVASGYFHLGLAYRNMGCRERAHGAFLSALCEGRTTVRPSLLDGYLQNCARTGEGCDAPCREERIIVAEQPLTTP
jgi:hypothetical protein